MRLLAPSALSLATLTSAVPVVRRNELPDFITKYAPLLHLYSQEPYLPADISSQITNTRPALNSTTVDPSAYPSPLTLDNLDQLNNVLNSNGGKDIYLTSLSDPTTDPRPQYLYGVTPDSSGKTNNAISSAIISVDKGSGITDVFYFYFYAFDYGGTYSFAGNVGNHIGDWEHNAIRFNNSLPSQIYYSQHSAGEAFTYDAVEKAAAPSSTGWDGDIRPVTYVANGTHANYATAGTHDHTIPGFNLPFGPIEDHANAGPLWDPTLSAYFYSYDVSSNTFTAYDSAPTAWLYFLGHWGDDMIPKNDSRQHCDLGIDALCQYVGGPTGPEDKDLARAKVCPDGEEGGCVVRPILTP